MAELLMQDQVVVVTGGGGGIGSAICRRLAEAGAKVVLTFRQSVEKTQTVADSLSGEGHLVLQALSTRKTTSEERARIRKLLDELERKG